MKTVLVVWGVLLYCCTMLAGEKPSPVKDSVKESVKDYSHYTGYKTGDTAAVYGGEAGISSHLYIFADESSCFTCMLSLQPIISTMRAKGHSKSTLFLRGASPEYIHSISERYGWDFEIVDDRIGAYMDKFRIKRVPFYLLLDARGVLRDMGEIATADFDMDRLIHVSDEIEKERQARKQPLSPVKKIPVRNGREPYLAGAIRFVSYDPRSREFVMIGPGSSAYAIADSSGAIKTTIDLAKFSQFDVLTPLPMSITPKPGVLLGGDSELENAERILYYLDYTRDSLALLQAPLNTDKYLIGYEFLATQSSHVVIGLHPRDYGDLSAPEFHTAMLLDSLARPVRTFGSVPRQYRDYYLDGFYWAAFTGDEQGRIYQTHNFGDMVYVYSPEGIPVDSVKYDLTTSPWYRDWRGKATGFHAKTTLEVKKEMSDEVSKLLLLLRDETTQELYVVYTNRMAPGHTAVDGKLYYYMHRVGERTDPVDVEIPNNGVPFYINNNMLYTTELTAGNALEIVVYSLIH